MKAFVAIFYQFEILSTINQYNLRSQSGAPDDLKAMVTLYEWKHLLLFFNPFIVSI